ncbi:MAG: CDP-alcohol phosphatidyltransferase family protein, partial [Myxococcota bacterium]
MKITANMVTVGRIALLPLPTAVLVFGNTFQVWLATVFAIALGATDAVDGYLARRDGPTVLGALLDPVADKLFLAAFLLPITAKHHAAFWVVSLIFLRELLITALRTSMELRSERLKTSQLGKLKTVVQMGGLAIYVFLLYTEEPFPKVLNAMGVVGLLVVLLVYALRRRPAPHWVAPAFCLWGLVLGATFFLAVEVVTFWVFLVITLVTWVSGADYLLGAARAYREVSLSRDEGVRLFWALANGAALVMVYRHPETLLPVMLMLAALHSLGGFDQL